MRGDRKVFLSLSQAETGRNFVCLGPQRRPSANEWCGLPPAARKPTSGCHTYAHVFEQSGPCLLAVFWKGCIQVEVEIKGLWLLMSLAQTPALTILQPWQATEKTQQNVGPWLRRVCCTPNIALVSGKKPQDIPHMIKNQSEARLADFRCNLLIKMKGSCRRGLLFHSLPPRSKLSHRHYWPIT